MVLYVVVRHWILIVAYKEAGLKGWGEYIQRKASLFYTDNSLIDSTRPECI